MLRTFISAKMLIKQLYLIQPIQQYFGYIYIVVTRMKENLKNKKKSVRKHHEQEEKGECLLTGPMTWKINLVRYRQQSTHLETQSMANTRR